MKDEMFELAREIADLSVWKWDSGMEYWRGGMSYRLAYKCSNSDTWFAYDRTGYRQAGQHLKGACPDLEDPATLGCIWNLVQNVWAGCSFSLSTGYGKTNLIVDTGSFNGSKVFSGPSLGHVLAYTLKAGEKANVLLN